MLVELSQMKNLAGVLINPAMSAFCRPNGHPESDKYLKIASFLKDWPGGGGGGGGGACDDCSKPISSVGSFNCDMLRNAWKNFRSRFA